MHQTIPLGPEHTGPGQEGQEIAQTLDFLTLYGLKTRGSQGAQGAMFTPSYWWGGAANDGKLDAKGVVFLGKG